MDRAQALAKAREAKKLANLQRQPKPQESQPLPTKPSDQESNVTAPQPSLKEDQTQSIPSQNSIQSTEKSSTNTILVRADEIKLKVQDFGETFPIAEEADMLTRIKRLEKIAELMYWTRPTKITTPESAGQSAELDRIFKYKTE